MNDSPESRQIRASSLCETILGAAIEVHRTLGPGLLESAYRDCLCHELYYRGVTHDRERTLPLRYRDVIVNCGYRLDIVVEDFVIVEIKSVRAIERVHRAQLLTYLKLTGLPVGLLLNFNVALLKDGIARMVNNL
ncbi:MAG: GxxExxY protein [Gemmatimonadota bacterium]